MRACASGRGAAMATLTVDGDTSELCAFAFDQFARRFRIRTETPDRRRAAFDSADVSSRGRPLTWVARRGKWHCRNPDCRHLWCMRRGSRCT